jgi:hypothetical protein
MPVRPLALAEQTIPAQLNHFGIRRIVGSGCVPEVGGRYLNGRRPRPKRDQPRRKGWVRCGER